jgi:hypothetical protein
MKELELFGVSPQLFYKFYNKYYLHPLGQGMMLNEK